jgi:hypothetical protein
VDKSRPVRPAIPFIPPLLRLNRKISCAETDAYVVVTGSCNFDQGAGVQAINQCFSEEKTHA